MTLNGMQTHTSVVLFYKYFIPAEIPAILHENAELCTEKLYHFLKRLCTRLQLKGRILLAGEGINGTLSAADKSILQEYRSEMENFDLLRDCGLSNDAIDDEATSEKRRIFRNIDWKYSSAIDEGLEPFPDLSIRLVKEIVSTGGVVRVDDIPEGTGKHLTPEQFHQALAEDHGKEVVLIDVRNTFEHDIGHFTNPLTGKIAMNPEMVTFSSFDSLFCAKYADDLKDKKVLMYCTGGIR